MLGVLITSCNVYLPFFFFWNWDSIYFQSGWLAWTLLCSLSCFELSVLFLPPKCQDCRCAPSYPDDDPSHTMFGSGWQELILTATRVSELCSWSFLHYLSSSPLKSNAWIFFNWSTGLRVSISGQAFAWHMQGPGFDSLFHKGLSELTYWR